MKRVCLVLVLLALQSFAQDTLSLEAAIQRALARHPDLSAAESRVQSQEGIRTQAGKTYNPIFNFQVENLRAWQSPAYRFSQDSDVFAFLQQQWELFGKRQGRVAEADAEVAIAELERELARRMVIIRVKQAYWIAVGAARSRELLAQNLATFEQTVAYHDIRVREGAMAEADLIRVRLEAERLRMDLQRSEMEAEQARIQLQLAMAEDRFEPVALQDPLDDGLSVPGFSMEPSLAAEQRLEVRIRRAVIRRNQASTQLARANAKPDLTWVAGYKRSGPFDALVLGAQVPVPILNRNEGAIASAAAEERFAAALLLAAEQGVRAEAESALRSYRVRRLQLERTLPALRAQANETAAIADAAYREGGAELLRLLDAQRVRIEAELLYAEALTQYKLSVVNLEAALGVPQ